MARTQKDRDEDLALGRDLERKDGQIDMLRTALEKVEAWLNMLAQQSDAQEKQNRGRFDSLADACRADAKNYRATAASIRKTLDA